MDEQEKDSTPIEPRINSEIQRRLEGNPELRLIYSGVIPDGETVIVAWQPE